MSAEEKTGAAAAVAAAEAAAVSIRCVWCQDDQLDAVQQHCRSSSCSSASLAASLPKDDLAILVHSDCASVAARSCTVARMHVLELAVLSFLVPVATARSLRRMSSVKNACKCCVPGVGQLFTIQAILHLEDIPGSS